jgi:UDP-glucose 4-epimerase
MIPMQMGERRAGDAEETVADAEKIKHMLGFKPMFSDLETIVKTAYKQSAN